MDYDQIVVKRLDYCQVQQKVIVQIFCKTRQFPYDAVIKAILITALEYGILTEASGDDGEI